MKYLEHIKKRMTDSRLRCFLFTYSWYSDIAKGGGKGSNSFSTHSKYLNTSQAINVIKKSDYFSKYTDITIIPISYFQISEDEFNDRLK